MIGPVSTTGRAMMASLQQAMSKGMPPDQAIAYVKSMAKDGVAPLVDLYAMMKQFERLKQPPAQMPQGGTIRDQLNSLDQGMSGGLGGLNAGAMENPQFAGGGIIAFQAGGPMPSRWEDVYAQDEAAAKALESEQGREAFMREQEAIRKQLGIGEFGEAKSLREKAAERLGREAESIEADEAALNEEQYWGDVASYASEAGATLLTSLSKAKKGSAERKRASKERVKSAVTQAEQAKILLAEANEARKAGDMNTYVSKLAAAKELSRESAGKVRDQQFKISERKEEQKGRERLQAIEDAARLALEERRGDIEERVRKNTASPVDRAGWDYLTKAEKFGDNDSKTVAALNRYLNMKRAAGGSLTDPPPNLAQRNTGAQTSTLPPGFVED